MAKNELLKFGRSETKRKDIKSIYINYAKWLRDNHLKRFSTEQIFEEWCKLGVYSDEKKQQSKKNNRKSININRECSLIKELGLGKIEKGKNDDRYLIQSSDVSNNVDSQNSIKLWGMEHIDFFFFQLLLKQKYKSNGKEESEFKDIYNYLKNNKFKLNEKILINKNYEDDIRNTILSGNIENILELTKYNSGSPGTYGKKRDMLRDNIVEKFIKLQVEKDENDILEINKLLALWNFDKFPDGFTSLLFGKKITINQFLKNRNKFPIKILTTENLLNNIKSRIIFGSKDSYLFLIKSHLNSLRILFEFNANDVLEIDFLQREQIENILSHAELNKLQLDKFYTVAEFMKIFDINNNVSFSSNHSSNQIIKEYYGIESIIQLLKNFKECYNENKEIRKKISDLIDNHPHVKGQCDKNTFFEFITGIAFLNKANKTSNEDLRNHLNTKLDSSLVPQRFAAGKMADASIPFQNNLINIEPTTQLYRQTEMELDGSRIHLENSMKNKEFERGVSVIVAPMITKKLTLDIKGWNEEKKNKMFIKLFDIDSLIEMLKSEKNIFEFIESHIIPEERLI